MSGWHGDPERGCGLMVVAGFVLVIALISSAITLIACAVLS